MNLNMNQCIIATSYIYTKITIINIAQNILYSNLIKNIEFQRMITTILDEIESNFKIDFFTIFTGPAPLLSLRATLSFIKGLAFIWLKNNERKIVLIGGNKCYWNKDYDIIVIQKFSNKFTVLYNENNYEEITTQSDLFCIIDQYKKVGFVARDNFNIKFNSKIGIILYPNIFYLSQQGLYKYRSSKWISRLDEITIYNNINN